MSSPPLIAYGDGPDCPRVSPGEVAELTGLVAPEVLLGWLVEPLPWLGPDSGVGGYAVMANGSLGAAAAAGRFRYLPVRLSAVPRLLQDVLVPEVAVVAGVRRGGSHAFRGTVGWAHAAASRARTVVVEVDEAAPDLGGPLIPGNIDHVVTRAARDDPPTAPRALDDVDLAVGRNAAALIPEGATIQIGPGGIAEAVLRSLATPVGVWSGLVTDALAELADRDLLIGDVTAGYVWGSAPVARLASAGRLRLLPAEETHDISRVASIPDFVACNAALEVGLDGSVNIERVGGRLVSGIGGHADFCAAASHSVGGISMIAVRSTTRRGQSTIVPRVEVVSTPRCDVDVVVTEHGVAWLRGINDHERARRLIGVAAPDHRSSLREAT